MAVNPDESLQWGDYLVIAAYFIFVLAVGLYTSWKSNRDSVGGYFLASRSMHWIPVGASLFASNIGSGHFVGLAGTAAAGGIAIAGFELSASVFLMMLGYFFVPVYMASGVVTMPEYIQKRFGGQRIRVYLSVLALLLYVFTKISADLFSGALFITETLQFKDSDSDYPLYIAVLILLAIACLFTIAGGLTAVIWTDFVQTILMIIGAFILTGMAFARDEIKGYEGLINSYFNSTAANRSFANGYNDSDGYCGEIPDNAMHLLRDVKSDLPWTGMTFGLAISAIWYWCADQVIVQRTLSARNMTHAKAGCIMASYMKLLPLWIMVFPGMAARVLFPDTVGCADPETCREVCKSESGCTNLAYVKLVNFLMPAGLRGLMLSVMLASLMSSLTSVFNSASTIFTMDIYTRFRKNAKETELLMAGRLFVLVLVVVSIVWIPIIRSSQDSQLFNYIQSITSFLAPPVTAVYILAIFWPRTNEAGAFWSLMIGLVVGLIRFGLEFGVSAPACGSGGDPAPEWWNTLIGNFHYLHFGLFLCGFTLVNCVIISLMTAPMPEDSQYRLNFWNRHSRKVRVPLEEEEIHEPAEHKTHIENKPIPKWRQALNCLCGVESNPPPPPPQRILTKEEEAVEAAEFLHEEPFWKMFVNVNAVACLAITAFVYGFFA